MFETNIGVHAQGPSGKARIHPSEFLDWAKQDIKAGSRRGIANGLTNAKRALHARIDEILYGVRVRFASDWSELPDTDLKLKALKRLDVPITTIVRVLTKRRNNLEHGYILPSLDEVRADVETAELWLEKSESYVRPSVVIGGLPTKDFGVRSSTKARKETVYGVFETPKRIIFFWDAKRKVIELKPDGSTLETDYGTVAWKKLIRLQRPFERVWPVPPRLATRVFRAYERWVTERKQCSFRC